jgi:hypothetical protein
MLAKEYYDAFYKKSTDGICLSCSGPSYWSPPKGKYLSYCCKKCQIKGIEKKYGVTNITNISPEKRKNTCLEKYGTEYVCMSEHAKDKLHDYWSSITEEELKQREQKTKKTCKERYGVDVYSKTSEFREKFSATMLDKYGVKHALQHQPFLKNQKASLSSTKSYTLPSGKIILIQGYEPQFLDFVFKENLLEENEILHEPFAIDYKDESGSNRKYYPDFYVPKLNLIVEIKSGYTEQQDKQTENKKQACLQHGYQYIRVVDNNFLEFKNLFI